MVKNAYVNARIEADLKKKAEAILEKLSLSKTDAIRLFYQQICLCNGLPFPVKIPNKVTRKVLDESEKGLGLHRARDLKDLVKKLNS